MKQSRPASPLPSHVSASGKGSLQRDEEFWFEDGSIVLQVESTQFRIAKTMFARHSNVFRDMLSLPLPADEPLVEGCPVVVLAGDKTKDWKCLLDAMYTTM